MNEVKILGARELYQALSTTIPRNMEGKVLQKALSAGTKLVLQSARRNAARGGGDFPASRTRTLVRAIYAARSKFNQSPTLEVRVVGVRKGKKASKKGKDAWYAKFIEYGRRAIRAKNGKLLVFKGTDGEQVFAKQVAAAPARPFMRPAWEENKDKALTAILAELKKQLDLAASKAKWR